MVFCLMLDGYDGDLYYYWGIIGCATDANDDDNALHCNAALNPDSRF